MENEMKEAIRKIADLKYQVIDSLDKLTKAESDLTTLRKRVEELEGEIIRKDQLINHISSELAIERGIDPDEDEFVPCNSCDGHDACADFGCAIEQGIIKKPDGIF